MTNVIPKDRNIGMVFQNYALFPNMTVWENIEFGLKMKKEKDYDEKIKNIIDMVGLTGKKIIIQTNFLEDSSKELLSPEL